MITSKSITRLTYAFITVGMIFSLTYLSGCIAIKPADVTPPAKHESSGKETGVTPTDSPQIPARGFFMGVLPLPADGQSFADAHLQASLYAEFAPIWGRPSPFYNLPDELSGTWGQTFVEQYTRKNGVFPIIHMSSINAGMTLKTPADISEATLRNRQWRNAYKQAALDVVKITRPLYLSIGNKVNRWYERYGASSDNSNGFQHYVSLYDKIYDAIRESSLETKVFCTFSCEIVSENRKADLEVLKMFKADEVDILALTSYPYAVQGINRHSGIPDDYCARVSNHMPGKPLGFSEIGWPALDVFGGEQSQADFIIQASTRLATEQGINLHLFGWPWLHDLDDNDSHRAHQEGWYKKTSLFSMEEAIVLREITS